jgi:methylated-DNA-protein-cysteine methyltransferase related protein
MMENNFFEKVYQVARQIPHGKVTTYGAIGQYLRSPKSARMVGWALNKSIQKNVPAHRVVNKQGLLTGKYHFDGVTLMEQLLENEGVAVKTIKFKRWKFTFGTLTKN